MSLRSLQLGVNVRNPEDSLGASASLEIDKKGSRRPCLARLNGEDVSVELRGEGFEVIVTP
jgi:hypothetical protein